MHKFLRISLLSSAFGILCFSQASLAQDSLTAYYKNLAPIEGQMVRALHNAQELYMQNVNYKTLNNEVFKKFNGYGEITDLRPSDMEGISFAPSKDFKRAIISIKTANCNSQIESMRKSLIKLREISTPEQVSCQDGAIVAVSNVKK